MKRRSLLSVIAIISIFALSNSLFAQRYYGRMGRRVGAGRGMWGGMGMNRVYSPPIGGYNNYNYDNYNVNYGNYNLNLSLEQQKKIQEMEQSLDRELLPLYDQLRTKNLELDNQYNRQYPNQTQIDNTTNAMAKIEDDIIKRETLHSQNIRNLLTEEQKAAYDSYQRGDPTNNYGSNIYGDPRLAPTNNYGRNVYGYPGLGRGPCGMGYGILNGGRGMGAGYGRGMRALGRGMGMGIGRARGMRGGRWY